MIVLSNASWCIVSLFHYYSIVSFCFVEWQVEKVQGALSRAEIEKDIHNRYGRSARWLNNRHLRRRWDDWEVLSKLPVAVLHEWKKKTSFGPHAHEI